MKSIMILSTVLLMVFGACGQDKSNRPSPPAKASQTTNNGVAVNIDYSQPAVKGRVIGQDIAPYGKVWRTGANEATVFEISKDVKIEGQSLPAGKYSLYSIPGKDEWVFIFNKSWNQSGTTYDKEKDALRVTVKPSKSPQFTERMTFNIAKSGKVDLLWGDTQAGFNVQ